MTRGGVAGQRDHIMPSPIYPDLLDLNSAEERRLTAARVPTHQVVQAPLSEVLERFELFPNFAVDLGQPPDIPDACDTCLSQNKHQDVGGHILKSEHPGGFV